MQRQSQYPSKYSLQWDQWARELVWIVGRRTWDEEWPRLITVLVLLRKQQSKIGRKDARLDLSGMDWLSPVHHSKVQGSTTLLFQEITSISKNVPLHPLQDVFFTRFFYHFLPVVAHSHMSVYRVHCCCPEKSRLHVLHYTSIIYIYMCVCVCPIIDIIIHTLAFLCRGGVKIKLSSYTYPHTHTQSHTLSLSLSLSLLLSCRHTYTSAHITAHIHKHACRDPCVHLYIHEYVCTYTDTYTDRQTDRQTDR